MIDKKVDNKDQLEVISESEQQKCKVILPCEPEEFKEFVSNLLKSSYVEMEGKKDGFFDLERQDIENIFFLINQRVVQQNQGILVYFRIHVTYSDGFSIKHASLEDFESFNQTNNCYPVNIVLSLNYLVTFPGKKCTEKQEIGVLLNTKHYAADVGRYEYRIKCTDITWGIDIWNLLEKQGEKIVEQPNLIHKISNLGIFTHRIIFTSALAIVSTFFMYHNYKLTTSPGFNVLSLKFAINSIWIFLVLTIAFSILEDIISVISGRANKNSSFIVLHECNRQYREKQIKKLRKSSLFIIASWFAGVIGSIVASYIYSFISL